MQKRRRLVAAQISLIIIEVIETRAEASTRSRSTIFVAQRTIDQMVIYSCFLIHIYCLSLILTRSKRLDTTPTVGKSKKEYK
jgi:hypothetical protein